MKKGIIFVLLLCLALPSFSLADAQQVQSELLTNDEGRTTLRLGISYTPEIDPGIVDSDAAIAVSTHLFRGLTQLNDSGEAIPDLAKSWEASENFETWTFKLNDELFWVDESGNKQAPLTARDVVFAWERSFDSDKLPLLDQSIIEECFAVDDRTIVYYLSEPYGGFPYLLSMPNTFPVPESLIEANGDDWDQLNLIWTSGPYYLQSFSVNESMAMQRNLHWPEANAIQTERVEITFADDQTLLTAYQQDDLDVAWLDDPSVLASIAEDPELANQVLTLPSLEVFGYVFGPYLLAENPQLRRALSLTIDRRAICEPVLGWDNPLGVMLPPGVFAHRANPIQIYDPVLAGRQLAEIGYEADGQIPLDVGYVDITSVGAINNQIFSYWDDFGFDLTVSKLTWEEMIYRNYLQEWDAPPDDIMMWRWAVMNPDPVYFYWEKLFNGRHLSGWQNEVFDDFLANAMATDSADERARYLSRAEEILLWEDPLFLPVCGRSHVFLAKTSVFLAWDPHRIFNAAKSMVNAAYKEAVEKETGVSLMNGDRDWTTREVQLFKFVYDSYKKNLGKDLLKNFGKLKSIERKKADGSTFGVFYPDDNKIIIYDEANSKFDFKNSDDQFKGTLAHEILHLLVTYNLKSGNKYKNRYENPLLKGYISAINKALDEETETKGKFGWQKGIFGWQFFPPDVDITLFFDIWWKAIEFCPPTIYAGTNPEEDFAEAIMFYLLDPERLDPARYEYIKNNIFNGKEFK